jgi:WD40 repeat protein
VRIWSIVAKKETIVHKICSNTDAIAWSPDSKRIATGDLDTIRIWNTLTGDCIATYKIQEKNDFDPSIGAIAWSPDGRYIASASRDYNGQDGRSSNAVQVWDISMSQCIFTYYSHVGLVDAVAWSPDGTRIASASLDRFSSTYSRMATIHIWVAPH